MAKAESKGQQVKTMKESITMPDLTTVEQITKVYFKVDYAMFYIYVPEHIGAAIEHQDHFRPSDHKMPAHVWADRLEDVINHWREIHAKYVRLVRGAGAVKVIKFILRLNHKGQMHNDPYRISHGTGLPRTYIGLEYEILWRSGTQLYTGYYNYEGTPEQELHLQHRGSVAGGTWNHHTIIDWTEEREEFFKRMVEGMEAMAGTLRRFVETDMEGNIARIMSGESPALLAAPVVAADG